LLNNKKEGGIIRKRKPERTALTPLPGV